MARTEAATRRTSFRGGGDSPPVGGPFSQAERPLFRASAVPVPAVNQARAAGNSAHPPETLSLPGSHCNPDALAAGGCPLMDLKVLRGSGLAVGVLRTIPSPQARQGPPEGLQGLATPQQSHWPPQVRRGKVHTCPPSPLLD